MSDVDEIVHRVRHDPAFAERLRVDPATVLRAYALDADDLRRIDRELAGGDRDPGRA